MGKMSCKLTYAKENLNGLYRFVEQSSRKQKYRPLNLYTNHIINSNRFFPFDRDSGSVPKVPIGGDLSTQDNQQENEEIPQSSVEHEDKPHSHEPTPPKGLVGVIRLLVKVLYLKQKGGGILSPSRQCNRVLSYRGVARSRARGVRLKKHITYQ